MPEKKENNVSVLSLIQAEIRCGKDLTNKFGGYNYRSAESILEAVKPLLAKHSAYILLGDQMVEVGGRVYVKSTAKIFDSNDAAWETTAYAREPEARKGMDDSQITGASSSYARKYALQGLLALDDGQDADSQHHDHRPEIASEAQIAFLRKLCDDFKIGAEDRKKIDVRLKSGMTADQAKEAEKWIRERVGGK